MQLTTQENPVKIYSLALVKSFLIWSFTLTVCLLVVGFPFIFLMVTIGALIAIALQAVLPISAVLLVAASLVSVNVLAVIVGAGILTVNGIHPQDVHWLSWLHGEPDPLHTPIFAACPLTCELR